MQNALFIVVLGVSFFGVSANGFSNRCYFTGERRASFVDCASKKLATNFTPELTDRDFERKWSDFRQSCRHSCYAALH
jgi:hypothetical protein